MDLEQKNPTNKTDYFLILTITVILTIFVVILIISYFFPGLLQKKANESVSSSTISSTVSASASPSQAVDKSTSAGPTSTPSTTSALQTYKDNSWGFEFSYPADYETVNDTYGWPHALVHLMPVAGGQSYEGQIEWWDTATQFKDTYGKDPKYITTHPNSKNWITINYYTDPNGIWQEVIESFKFQ